MSRLLHLQGNSDLPLLSCPFLRLRSSLYLRRNLRNWDRDHRKEPTKIETDAIAGVVTGVGAVTENPYVDLAGTGVVDVMIAETVMNIDAGMIETGMIDGADIVEIEMNLETEIAPAPLRIGEEVTDLGVEAVVVPGYEMDTEIRSVIQLIGLLITLPGEIMNHMKRGSRRKSRKENKRLRPTWLHRKRQERRASQALPGMIGRREEKSFRHLESGMKIGVARFRRGREVIPMTGRVREIGKGTGEILEQEAGHELL